MASIRTKLEPFERDATLLFPEVFSPQARSRALADFARSEKAKTDSINRSILGRVPPSTVAVDGRQGASLDSVKPDGVIVFEYELLDDVLAWIGAMLVKHSPVGSQRDKRPGHPGLYSASHILTADNVVVEPGAPLPAAERYAFVNSQPYARKIERGLSDQAPHGVYESIAGMAQSRFGNIAHIRFGYEAPLFGAIEDWARKTNMPSPYRRGVRREEWLRRQPAIKVSSY